MFNGAAALYVYFHTHSFNPYLQYTQPGSWVGGQLKQFGLSLLYCHTLTHTQNLLLIRDVNMGGDGLSQVDLSCLQAPQGPERYLWAPYFRKKSLLVYGAQNRR